LQISATGDVVGVVITSENPPGVFGSAVDREARRMKYTPARRDCENVSDDVPLQVQFKLGE
jgi:periplasmic protein TonB